MSNFKRRTRIKICGMTDVNQVEHAVSLGVDAIGLILHANSPRLITLEQAQLIRKVVPAFVSLVGVFVDADRERVESAVELVGLDIVQLHGAETEEFAQSLPRPYIKAVRAKSIQQVMADCEAYPSARGILLDPYVKGQHGGTGQSLDLGLWPDNHKTQGLILAGGLSADNIAERISAFAPFAVDLNSGLETKPGVKDQTLVAKAVREVQLADCLLEEH